MSIKIDVSVGEIMDKLTILEIKSEKIQDEAKLANVCKERDSLLPAIDQPAYQTDEVRTAGRQAEGHQSEIMGN